MPITSDDIRHALTKLDLDGQIIGLHSSLTSFSGSASSSDVASLGGVQGGARTIVDAMRDADCSLLAPTFTYQCQAPPPPDVAYSRNGYEPNELQAMTQAIGERPTFDPAANLLSRRAMGVVPAAVLTTPNRVRGNHPLNSFTGLGEWADSLVRVQQPLDVYAPLRALVAARGWILLMGVDLRSFTLIHLAEQQAGRTLFRRWARTVASHSSDRSEIVECDVGSCSRGFNNFDTALAPFERRLQVGLSLWRILPAREALDACTAAIKDDPEITRCTVDGCVRCADTIAGGPLLS
jgi:aminoglycoside N3'-acetyltransferase